MGPPTNSDTFFTIRGPVNLTNLLYFGMLAGVSCNGLKNFNHFSDCNFVCNFISGSSEKPTNGHHIEYSESKYLKLSSAVECMELEYCDLQQHV